MNETLSLDDFIASFPIIGMNIADGLEELLEELEENHEKSIHTIAAGIMIQAAQLQALQAIAVGLRDLVNKEN